MYMFTLGGTDDSQLKMYVSVEMELCLLTIKADVNFLLNKLLLLKVV